MSDDANTGPVFSDVGRDVGPPGTDQTGATYILVAGPGYAGGSQLRQHGFPIVQTGQQPRLVHIRLR